MDQSTTSIEPSTNKTNNKTPLEELSKDELIKKCKGLLVIAQKAKQTKDTLQEENNELKNKLKDFEVSKEIIENLSRNQVEHVTTIDRLKHRNVELEEKLVKTIQELEICQNVGNENVALKRQNKRLTDENEDLLKQLEQLEKKIEKFNKIAEEQQAQLLVVENLNNDKKLSSDFAELQKTLDKNIEENQRIKLENSELTEKIDNLKLNLIEKDKNILVIGQELAQKNQRILELESMENSEKLRKKIRFYHGKIVKFAGNVKVLKENKNEILKSFKVYVEQVEDWKLKLTAAALQLIQYIEEIKNQNDELIKNNNSLKETNAKIIEQLEAHKTDDEKTREFDELNIVKADNRRLTDEINNLIKLEEEYKKEIQKLIEEKEMISRELENAAERHQEEIRVFDDQNKRDNREIQSRIEENEKICIEYRKIISKLENDIEINMREMEELRSVNSTLQEQLQHLKSNEKEFANKTSEEILKLVHENAELTKLNRELLEKCNNRQQVSCQTEVNENQDEIITKLKSENAEVLSEMNEMNQALKERGETISKLQAHCDEIMKKLQIYETQANKNVDNISQKEELIKNLQEELETLKNSPRDNKEINDLKNEIESLKEKINESIDDNMSTSTISKADESNRLKELEGSWEERYSKLRSLAIKLKGKIRDLTNELTKEQSEKNELQSKLSNATKTITTLQSQCDKLQDDLEVKQKEYNDTLNKLDSVAVDISKDKQKLAEREDIIDSLKREIEEYRKDKTATELWKQQIGSKVQTFRKELEANKVMKREYESKIAKLTQELEEKVQALKLETDSHQQTKNSLQFSNNERKKNSVLNLEMQDYERSVKELSIKLEKKQETINKLKIQLDSQKTKIDTLKEQNKIFEERIAEIELAMNASNVVVNTQKKQITDLEELLVQKDNNLQSVQDLLETTRSENEELSTELSKLVAEHQKVNTLLRNEKEELRSKNLGLQQSLREVQENLKLKLDELRVVQNDYENYKVRAQSVLRQNQNRDVALEEKLMEEVGSLKTTSEGLTTELAQCRKQIEELIKKNTELENEKDELSTKYNDVNSELEELKSSYDQLSSKHQQTIIEHSEAIRNLKIHSETLAQCYRQQLAELEMRHNREILEYQNKLDNAILHPSPSETPITSNQTTGGGTATTAATMMMPREEGEGSESIESINRNSLHPVPLERLLATATNDDQEITFIKKQLAEEESKVKHLTALLSDTEQDLVKHVQMNKLLKEEIRRQQRSEEREKHAENLEYLKNVVFKFVTLHSGDERSRLVPVLNTILKLSPEETQKLTSVAKGEQQGLLGWSNYLPGWSPSKT